MEQKINNSSSKGGGREGAILSDRLNRLAPSATLAMSQRSSELKAQGIDVINMSVGEPDFNTPDHIKAAAIKAVEDNWSRYSPVPGYPELKKAIANKLKNENGLDYAPSQILCSNGAKQSVCNTIMALVNAGDEVIIPAPYWVSYPQMVLLAEGTPVFVEATIEQDFKITPAQLEAAITPKTRALILCSPSNPTGSVYSKAELVRGIEERTPEIPQHNCCSRRDLRAHQLRRRARINGSVPRYQGARSHHQWCQQGIRYDWLAYWFHCRSRLDCEGL